mgnify:CR=1 FL=1
MKNIIFIILAGSLLLMTSCGGKGKTNSSFSLSLGAVTSGTPQNGGVIITGRKIDDSAHMQLGFAPGEELSVDLENGVWEFAAVSWVGVGGEMFTGDHNCGYVAPMNLQGGDININFSLSPANCDDIISDGERFSDASHFSSAFPNQFRVLKIRSCLTNPITISGTSCMINGEKGLTKSYKLVFGDSDGIVKSLSSSCYNISNQDDDGDIHHVKIPIGDNNGNVFSYKLRAYTDVNCSGDMVNYRFYDGIFRGLLDENKSSLIDNTLNGEITYLFLEHNPLTQSIDANPLFGFGDLGDEFINTNLDLTASSYSRIVGINAADTRIITVANSTLFSPHEEVMWLSNEEGTMGNACAGFVPGIYAAARVKKIIDSTTIELYEQIDHYILDGGTMDVLALPTGTSLAEATNTTMFCSMQLIKSSNYENLTIDGAGGTTYIKPFPYNKASGVGGVLAIKVKNKLRTEGSNVVISADQKGRAVGETFTYAACPAGKKCAYLGDNNGGGILFINAAHLEIDSTVTNLSSRGAVSGTVGGNGGSILFIGHKIDVNSGKDIQLLASGGDGSSLGGDGGYVNYNYCLSDSTQIGTFSATDVTGGSASTAGLPGNDFSDTSFCPL